jgi:hypothetical protein
MQETELGTGVAAVLLIYLVPSIVHLEILRFGRILEIEIYGVGLGQKSHGHPCHDLEDFRDT